MGFEVDEMEEEPKEKEHIKSTASPQPTQSPKQPSPPTKKQTPTRIPSKPAAGSNTISLFLYRE